MTKRTVDALAPTDKRFVVWDKETKGFGVRVNRDGTKTFIVKYFVNGRQRWLSVGKFGILTVDEARKEARYALGAAARGEDVAQKKKNAKTEAKARSLSLKEFCVLYLSDAEAGKVTYRGRPKKASTLEVDRGRIKRHIVPLIGAKRLCDISPDDIEAFRHSVRLGKTATTVKTGPRGVARVRGGETASNRAIGLLGSIFSYAVKLKLREDNPVRGVERYQDRKRQRALLPNEYRALGQALDDLTEDGANPWAVLAFRTLAFVSRQHLWDR